MSFQPYRITVKRSIMKIYILEFKSKMRNAWVNLRAFESEDDAKDYLEKYKAMDNQIGIDNWGYRIETLDLSLKKK